MTRTVVVPFHRRTTASLDRLLARVPAEDRAVTASLLCVRQHHDHTGGGCIEAPRGYAPRPISGGAA